MDYPVAVARAPSPEISHCYIDQGNNMMSLRELGRDGIQGHRWKARHCDRLETAEILDKHLFDQCQQH